jgi:hypothetical protein
VNGLVFGTSGEYLDLFLRLFLTLPPPPHRFLLPSTSQTLPNRHDGFLNSDFKSLMAIGLADEALTPLGLQQRYDSGFLLFKIISVS